LPLHKNIPYQVEIDAAADDVGGIDRLEGGVANSADAATRDTRQGSQLNHMSHPTSGPTTHFYKKAEWQY